MGRIVPRFAGWGRDQTARWRPTTVPQGGDFAVGQTPGEASPKCLLNWEALQSTTNWQQGNEFPEGYDEKPRAINELAF